MKEKKLFESPTMIVVKLSGKAGFMYISDEPAGVREYHGKIDDNDWE